MALVEAHALSDAFDNGAKGQEPRFYYRGLVRNFDTANRRLNGLTTPRGDWVFQYPGHEGKNPAFVPPKRASEAVREEEPVPVTAEGKPDRRFKKTAGRRSKARNAAMIASRAANKAARQERIDAEIAAETQQESTATA